MGRARQGWEMSDNEFEPYKVPALGKAIARVYVTLGAPLKRYWPRGWSLRVTDDPRQRYLNYLVFYVLLFFPVWVSGIGGVLLVLFDLFAGHFQAVKLEADDADPDDHRWRYLSITAFLAALGALIAVPFSLVRVYVNERQARTAEEGLLTERITRAVEQLGAEKTVKRIVDGVTEEYTEPNLEVRLGAIYALERISQDSLRDHIPIMETLCAYVRNNARAEAAKNFPLGPFPERIEDDDPNAVEKRAIRAQMINLRRQNWIDWLDGLGPFQPPRDDVAAVLKVIARRSPAHRTHEDAAEPPFRLDFTRANLQRCDLTNLDFVGADMRYARLEGANLRGAEMEGANLSEAKMDGANLSEAKIKGAKLRWANMEGAELFRAKMEGAYLFQAKMEGANLIGAKMEDANLRGARMEGANLGSAKMEGAYLAGTKMEGAYLSGTKISAAHLSAAVLRSADLRGVTFDDSLLRSVDFTGARDLTQTQLDAAIGDENTKLPRDAETGARLYVWSHWETRPSSLDRLLARYSYTRRDKLIAEWVKPTEPPYKTGRDAETGEVYSED